MEISWKSFCLFFCFLHFPNLAVTEGICFYAIFYKNFEQFLVENFWKSFEYILLRMLQQTASILIFLAIPLQGRTTTAEFPEQ